MSVLRYSRELLLESVNPCQSCVGGIANSTGLASIGGCLDAVKGFEAIFGQVSAESAPPSFALCRLS